MGDNGIMQVCNPTTTELENATVVTMTESQSLEKDPLEYSEIRIDDEIKDNEMLRDATMA